MYTSIPIRDHTIKYLILFEITPTNAEIELGIV